MLSEASTNQLTPEDLAWSPQEYPRKLNFLTEL